MINFFADFIEDITSAAKSSIREITDLFLQEKVKMLAEATQKELRKATPESKVKTLHGKAQVGDDRHTKDLWEIEYKKEGGKITSFEIVNTKSSLLAPDEFIIDYLEYGTPPHGPKTADVMFWTEDGRKIFADWVQGIKPMGFVRKTQAEMDRTLPAFMRQAFERPIEKHW